MMPKAPIVQLCSPKKNHLLQRGAARAAIGHRCRVTAVRADVVARPKCLCSGLVAGPACGQNWKSAPLGFFRDRQMKASIFYTRNNVIRGYKNETWGSAGMFRKPWIDSEGIKHHGGV